jgi:hypothetical protein
MTLMANSNISLLAGLDSTKNQPAMSTHVVGGSSSFLQTLNYTAGELDSPTDFDGLVPATNSALETAVLVLDGASLKPSNPIDAAKEIPATPVAPVADAVWLAHWFQKNSPATVSSPVPLLGSSSDPVEAELPMDIGGSVKLGQSVGFKDFNDLENGRWSSVMSGSVQVHLEPHAGQGLPHHTAGTEAAPHGPGPEIQSTSDFVGTANLGVEQGLPLPKPPQSSAPATVTSPIGLPVSDKPLTALANATAAMPNKVAVSLPLPPSSAAPSIFQPSSQLPAQSTSRSASIGLGVLDNKSPQNLPSGSSHLRPTEVFSKLPMDSGGSVKLFQAVGFKDFNDLENGRWLAVSPGSAKVRLDSQVGQDLPHPAVGAEVAPLGLGPDVQWAENFAGTADQGVEQGLPLPVPSHSNAPVAVTSPFALPVSDKPVIALANAPASTPSNVAASLSLPTSSVIQATSQPVSIQVVILEKKSPKNLSIDSDRLKPMEVLSKATMDIGGVLKLGQSVEFKDYQDFKDFENDRRLPVMPGSGQVSFEAHAGQNLTHQTVSTEAAPPGLDPDAQWTSNLADTVNQWVEQSLHLADLTIPDAGQGSLQVRIELKGQEATVYFLTDHDQYRAAIESQIENLSDRLADQGLKLAGSFVGQGHSQNSPQQQSAHSMLSRRPESEPTSPKGLSIDPVLRDMKSVPHGRVLDVFA